MHFHVQLIDDPEHPERRAQHREAHWAYFDAYKDHFVARGATRTDDLENYLSSVIFVEFDGWAEVRNFIDNEPLNSNGVYKDVRICRWHQGIKRNQRDFPRSDDQSYWYIRGFGRPDANDRRNELLDAHRAYFAPYDGPNFITRGAVLDDAGEKWVGSANLIALPDRAAVDGFMVDEPFYKDGLYDHVLIERYKFGGRVGQVV
ncbi:MAG: hypothetical protein GKS01_10160 [Alphaproteobacteria bacterium]|nr:hypothetical protein [Alphaproteobacteria bacterium]